jgi:hypothetical protein
MAAVAAAAATPGGSSSRLEIVIAFEFGDGVGVGAGDIDGLVTMLTPGGVGTSLVADALNCTPGGGAVAVGD